MLLFRFNPPFVKTKDIMEKIPLKVRDFSFSFR